MPNQNAQTNLFVIYNILEIKSIESYKRMPVQM